MKTKEEQCPLVRSEPVAHANEATLYYSMRWPIEETFVSDHNNTWMCSAAIAEGTNLVLCKGRHPGSASWLKSIFLSKRHQQELCANLLFLPWEMQAPL